MAGHAFVYTLAVVLGHLAVCADGAECEYEPSEVEVPMEMLQHRHSLGSDAETEIAPMTLPSKVTWFHVPRTGSSFMHTLRTMPEVCSDATRCSESTACEEMPSMKVVWENCPGLQMASSCEADHKFNNCAEVGLGEEISLGRMADSKLVGFFRQPEQRLLSDWTWDCGGVKMSNVGILTTGAMNCTMSAFMEERQGCVTKMLTYPAPLPKHCANAKPEEPSWDQVYEAERIISEEFAFVGLTEKWDLSICLFNAMYGNKCHSNQFLYSATTKDSSSSDYDTAQLNGWVDKYDGYLYEAVQEIFYANLRKFAVSEDACVPCTDEN